MTSNKIDRNNAILLCVVYALIIIFTFVQNYFGVFSFDDFGYGSLTYGLGKIGFPVLYNKGNNYNMVEIIKYLKWHYNNWGGRIIIIFLQTIFFKFNTIVIKVFQTIVLLFYFKINSEIASDKNIRSKVLNIIFVFSFFWTCNIAIYRDGVMWYSAAAGYLWTSVLVCWLIKEVFSEAKVSKKKLILTAILFLIGGWSHELVGIMLCVTSTINMLYRRLALRKKELKYLIYSLCSYIGYAILVFAPGNRVRMKDASAASFYKMSIVTRLTFRAKEEIQLLFTPKLLPIVILLLLCIWIIAINIFKIRNKGINRVLPIIVPLIMILYGLSFIIASNSIIRGLVLLIISLIAFYCLVIEVAIHKNIALMAVFLGWAAMLVGAMFAPYGGDRTLLPLYLFSVTIFMYTLKLTKIKINIGIVLLVSIVAIINYTYIFDGYSKNYIIRSANERTLELDSKNISQGKKINIIMLNKYDLNFSESNPWGDAAFQQIWMKNYYKIPQEVKIEFK